MSRSGLVSEPRGKKEMGEGNNDGNYGADYDNGDVGNNDIGVNVVILLLLKVMVMVNGIMIMR